MIARLLNMLDVLLRPRIREARFVNTVTTLGPFTPLAIEIKGWGVISLRSNYRPATWRRLRPWHLLAWFKFQHKIAGYRGWLSYGTQEIVFNVPQNSVITVTAFNLFGFTRRKLLAPSNATDVVQLDTPTDLSFNLPAQALDRSEALASNAVAKLNQGQRAVSERFPSEFIVPTAHLTVPRIAYPPDIPFTVGPNRPRLPVATSFAFTKNIQTQRLILKPISFSKLKKETMP
jgi:hypothetical protein